MDTDELREALERADLTTYQADAYLTLLDLGVAPAVDVAKQSSVPVSQVYKVLDDLEAEGYVETIDREQLHARPRDPVEVLNDLRSYSETLSEAADEIEDRWRVPHEQDHQMSVVKHQSTIHERVRRAIAEADHSIELAADPDQFEDLVPALREAHEEGIVTRLSIYSGVGDDESVADAPFEGAVVQARKNTLPGPFLAIVDRRHTYFAPNERSNEPYGVVVNDSILSFVFHWYFQTCLWSPFERVYEATDGPLPYISVEEFIQDFIELWWEGATIRVCVRGYDNNESRMRTVEGAVTDIWYPGVAFQSEAPALDDLSSWKTVLLSVDGEPYTVGGWGAIYEDMESYELIVTGIEFDLPDEAAAGPERAELTADRAAVPDGSGPRRDDADSAARGADADSAARGADAGDSG